MRVRIDRSSSVPESEQVRLQISSLVERGTLAPGERLSTVKALAEQLGLAVNTVAKAYRLLEEAGALVGRGRRGTFVADASRSRASSADRELAEAAEAYARVARRLGAGPAEALEQARGALAPRRAT